MKKIVLLLVLLSTVAQAQYTIKGAMTTPKKNNWVLLYKVEGARQVFIKNTNIKKEKAVVNGQEREIGTFNFELPADAKPGSYRVTYQLKGGGFVDFLFNKENVAFTFDTKDPESTIVFSASKDNSIYQEYLYRIGVAQHKTDSLQVAYLKKPSKNLADAYKKSINDINTLQKKYAQQSKGTLAHNFIKATNRYNSPTISTSSRAYVDGVVNHFFDNINFEDKTLYNSSFLVDRINDYVFYLNYSDDGPTQEKLHKNAIHKVLGLVKNKTFKRDVIEFLISQFTSQKNVVLVDYLFDNYYKKLPATLQNQEFTTKILESLVAEVGRIAPDFSWKSNQKSYTLSALNDAQNYILVFWSTGCSHCLREIPKLYEKTKDLKNIKVIAFSLETEAKDWNNYIPKLKNWHNVLGLKKWDNKIARTYQIYSTPTYFILNKDKKIIAKSRAFQEVEKMINMLK